MTNFHLVQSNLVWEHIEANLEHLENQISGIRTGADVFTALALGADAVLLGRPHMYGLAIAGQRGVEEVVANVIAELDLTMALTGAATIADITRDLLVPNPSFGG